MFLIGFGSGRLGIFPNLLYSDSVLLFELHKVSSIEKELITEAIEGAIGYFFYNFDHE
jgi:hypothetical protein